MSFAESVEENQSVWEVHRGHIVLFAVWVLIVGGVLLASWLRKRRAGSTSAPKSTPRPVRNGWLWIAALATVASGAIHLAVIREHFEESTLYGAFFLVLTVLQFGWALWLVIRPSVVLFAAGGAASLGVALLWLATRTAGIPLGAEAGEKEAVGSLDVVASATEVLVAVCAVVAIWGISTHRTRPRVAA
jgi:hypothetical protein